MFQPAYRYDTLEGRRLQRQVEAKLGQPMRSFHGCRYAHSFVLRGIGATYRRRIAELDIIFCSPAQLREKRSRSPI